MSIGGITAAATTALTTLLYKTAQRQIPTLTTSAESWANSGSTFLCNYEQASLYAQGQFDYQGGAGYTYDVWVLPTQTVNAGDRIVVAADSMTFKVLDAGVVGAPGPLRRLRCQKLN